MNIDSPPWPTATNPCKNPVAHTAKGLKAPMWKVKGYVTQCCLWCVDDATLKYAEKVGLDTKTLRQYVLDHQFVPDLNGVKFSSPLQDDK